MSLYRRGSSPIWWCRIFVAGVKVRRSSRTDKKAAAEEFESRLRTSLWRQHNLGEKPRYTWEEAVARWYREASGRGRDRDRERLRWFDPYLSKSGLADIDLSLINQLREIKCHETSQSTANRHMALLRTILRKAQREWQWITSVPAVPMYRIERSEPRFLTRSQFSTLLEHLPPHLKNLAEFSVETGLRMRNVTHLHWEQVDLERRLVIVSAGKAKAGRTLSIPLSSRAVGILQAVARASNTSTTAGPIFMWRGKEMDDANGASFKSAASLAGVPWLRWHDLRHTWASWHIQAGTPPHVLQELGGWRSYEMVRRYAHLNPSHLARYVEHKSGHRAEADPLSST